MRSDYAPCIQRTFMLSLPKLAPGTPTFLLCPSLSLSLQCGLKSSRILIGFWGLLYSHQLFLFSHSGSLRYLINPPSLAFSPVHTALPIQKVENTSGAHLLLWHFGLNLVIKFALAVSEEEGKGLRLSLNSNCFIIGLRVLLSQV